MSLPGRAVPAAPKALDDLAWSDGSDGEDADAAPLTFRMPVNLIPDDDATSLDDTIASEPSKHDAEVQSSFGDDALESSPIVVSIPSQQREEANLDTKPQSSLPTRRADVRLVSFLRETKESPRRLTAREKRELAQKLKKVHDEDPSTSKLSLTVLDDELIAPAVDSWIGPDPLSDGEEDDDEDYTLDDEDDGAGNGADDQNDAVETVEADPLEFALTPLPEFNPEGKPDKIVINCAIDLSVYSSTESSSRGTRKAVS